MVIIKNQYPDGGIYATITDFSNPVITRRINTYEDLFFIKSIKDVCDYNNIQDVELNIPCMFQQQHDRRFGKNQSFELKLVSEFIDSCNFKRVRIFHPHNDSAVLMGIKNLEIIDNSEFITEVLEELPTEPILLSTDGGSFKWINKLADTIGFKGEVYGANKSRDAVSHNLVQVIDRQDFGGRDILVLDDILVGGATFIGLGELLKSRNIGKLYAAVSHTTVKSPRKELETLYDRIFTTNSKYDEYNLSNITVMDVLNYFN